MIRKNFFRAIIIGLSSTMINTAALANEVLTAEQVKELYSDKTFDGHHETKDMDFRIYSAADGNFLIILASGKTMKRYWQVDKKGRHCVSEIKGNPGRCSSIISLGNGVYKKMTMGIHSHTLKNFVSGNQL